MNFQSRKKKTRWQGELHKLTLLRDDDVSNELNTFKTSLANNRHIDDNNTYQILVTNICEMIAQNIE